jgi:hypothetical protein
VAVGVPALFPHAIDDGSAEDLFEAAETPPAS